MFKALKSFFKDFARDERAALSVEAVISFPMLFYGFCATFVFFDAFREQSVSLKTAYTIGDILSRETNYVTPTYLNSLWKIQEAMTSSEEGTKLRVTIVRWSDTDQDYSVVWSKTEGGGVPLTDATLDDYVQGFLPALPDNNILVVVENWVHHDPLFNVGIDPFDYRNVVPTRPRFSSTQLCWNDREDGDITTQVC